MTRQKLEQRWDLLTWLLAPFVLGLAGVIAGVAFDFSGHTALAVIGMLLALPLIIYLNLFVVWHWKSRYKGEHSDLWGAAILLETSGWMKLVYLFRTILPDVRKAGRYREFQEAATQ